MSQQKKHKLIPTLLLALGCLGATVLLALGFALFDRSPLDVVDEAAVSIAVRFQQESKQESVVTHHDIVMVDIDDESIAALGRVNQWPRRYDAQVIAYIGSGKPKAIGLDLIYTEHDTLPPIYRELLADGGVNNIAEVMQALSTDQFLKMAFAMSGNVFIAMFDDQLIKDAPDTAAYACLPRLMADSTVVENFHHLHYPVLPIDMLRNSAKGVGSINEPTVGGEVRRYVTVQALPGKPTNPIPLIANFPVLMVMHALQIPPESVSVTPGTLHLGSQRNIPIDSHGEFALNWLGQAEKFRHISYHKVLEGQMPPDFFEDKYVIMGATAAGLNDTKTTPRGMVPGMVVHATALFDMLNNEFLHELTIWNILPVLALLAFGFQFLFLRLSPVWSVVSLLLLMVAEFAAAALYFYPSLQMVVPVSQFFLLSITSATSALIYKYITEGRERGILKKAFSTYVPADVVDEILQNQGAMQLGGVKMKLTVLFSDIRGFTTFSEALDPQELVAFLNYYLSRMSEVIFTHRGTIDKFIGDAIMAIFGAPLTRSDNAARACITCLEMIKELDVVNQRQREMNQPECAIGIGLNSGEMTVGNVGSDKRFDYTVIGDAVNLGSRLEGLNKYFHTQILVSDSVREEAGDAFIFREMAPVKVKGKDIPVGVYELIDVRENAAKYTEWFAAFNKAFDVYKDGKLAEAIPLFKAAQLLREKDGGTMFFIDRCNEYLDHPEEFSVVVKMEGK